MTDNRLTLFCVVEGDSLLKAFEVEISSTKTVSALKKAIRGDSSVAFADVDAKELTLWCASISNNKKGSAITIDALGNKTELDDPRALLSELFPESPDRNTYILVRRPAPAAASSTSTTVPLLSILDVLNRPLPPLSWLGNNEVPSSTTDSRYSRTPTEIIEWTDFPLQAAVLNHPTDRTFNPADFRFTTDLFASNEEYVGHALSVNVYDFLNRIQTTTRIGPYSDIARVTGKPDRICYIRTSQELRMLIEIETTQALFCNNLVTKYTEDMALIANDCAPRNPTWHQVHQIFGYLCHNSLKYGILTTYDNTWFMRRDVGTLWISHSIRHDNTSPTLLQSYKYLMEITDQDYTSPPPPPSPSQSPPPESPPRDDNVDDSNDDSYHERKKRTRKQDQQQPGIVTRSRHKIKQFIRELPSGFTVSVGKLSLQEFEIQGLLGEGRTGRVFHATWQGEPVALKICDLYKNPEYEDDILTEVAAYKALGALQGVCIPRFKTAGHDGGIFAIAMEIAGSPMEVDELSRRERLKVVDSLSLIHRHGIVHNDIRLNNVLVCRHDNGFQVRFIDFARSRRSCDELELKKEMIKLKYLLGGHHLA